MKGKPLPFDNIFSQAGGFVARQVADNPLQMRLLTWEFTRDCTSFVTLPINVSHDYTRISAYSRGVTFCDWIERHELTGVRFLDLNILFDAVTGIVRRHRALASKAGVYGPFFAKAHLENVWRTVPFLDLPIFAEHINKFGVPIVQATDVLIPPVIDPMTFIVLDECRDLPSPVNEFMKDAISITIPLFQALGVPGDLFIEDLGELVSTGERFKEVQGSKWSPGFD